MRATFSAAKRERRLRRRHPLRSCRLVPERRGARSVSWFRTSYRCRFSERSLRQDQLPPLTQLVEGARPIRGGSVVVEEPKGDRRGRFVDATFDATSLSESQSA